MSFWILVVLAAAVSGAYVVWHGVGRTKHTSEMMLGTYAQMLAEARAKKRTKLIQQRLEAIAEDTQPTE